MRHLPHSGSSRTRRSARAALLLFSAVVGRPRGGRSLAALWGHPVVCHAPGVPPKSMPALVLILLVPRGHVRHAVQMCLEFPGGRGDSSKKKERF
ncbi:hypothetical protein NDU88_004685 [Pleurodeles waltl]|uniref:Secreted protein n=1 Tax=Pleurodeles waltl TaxID=8319 RepID=A0AAV7PFQ5_PLEWA|nr:hypothetical protein NDU88_004685 [Pleurodeles waltl]